MNEQELDDYIISHLDKNSEDLSPLGHFHVTNDPKPNPVGRPTVMTPEVVNKLIEVFSIGGSDTEACLIAGISRKTLYEYIKDHPEFGDRKEELKEMPKYLARKNITEAISAKDKTISQWYLERKSKAEFSTRIEATGADGEALNRPYTAEELATAEKLKELDGNPIPTKTDTSSGSRPAEPTTTQEQLPDGLDTQ